MASSTSDAATLGTPDGGRAATSLVGQRFDGFRAAREKRCS
jgi:hypothetical protein